MTGKKKSKKRDKRRRRQKKLQKAKEKGDARAQVVDVDCIHVVYERYCICA